jgi:hypothetical protein
LISQVDHLLLDRHKEYYGYFIVKRRGEVYHLLLLSTLQLSTWTTSCPPAYDGGQRVDCLLHCKEERRSIPPTPVCVSSPLCNGLCNILLLILYLASRLSPPLPG